MSGETVYLLWVESEGENEAEHAREFKASTIACVEVVARRWVEQRWAEWPNSGEGLRNDAEFVIALRASGNLDVHRIKVTAEVRVSFHAQRINSPKPPKSLPPRYDEIYAEGTKRLNAEAEGEQLHVFVCGKTCDAGGPPEKQGHVFDIEWESDDGLSGGYKCKCGLDNISFSMWNDP
jgi:hypothetical protein